MMPIGQENAVVILGDDGDLDFARTQIMKIAERVESRGRVIVTRGGTRVELVNIQRMKSLHGRVFACIYSDYGAGAVEPLAPCVWETISRGERWWKPIAEIGSIT